MKFWFFAKILACLFFAAGIAFEALAQALPGDYQMIGRRCEDTQKLAPPDGATHKMRFNANGSFRHTYFIINSPQPEEGGLTMEEYAKQRRERKTARFLGYFEEEKTRHEALCRTHGPGAMDDGKGNDACEGRYKRALYERWRRERLREAEEELARDEAEDRKFIEENTKECFVDSRGQWAAQGNRLTITLSGVLASEGCGSDFNSGSQRVQTMAWRLQAGPSGDRLYLILPASAGSREFCGASDWAEIYSRIEE